MKVQIRQQFRWAPHTIGMTQAKPKDYEVVHEAEAESPYALWLELKDTSHALEIGDILEPEAGVLRIYKYVGFEEAQWHIPEPKSAEPEAEPPPPAAPPKP